MIDISTVWHIAKLARLDLSQQEAELYQKQLASILEYIQKLKELNLQDTTPLAHAADISNIFKYDLPKQHLPHEDILKNAPQKTYGFFEIPKVIEEM